MVFIELELVKSLTWLQADGKRSQAYLETVIRERESRIQTLVIEVDSLKEKGKNALCKKDFEIEQVKQSLAAAEEKALKLEHEGNTLRVKIISLEKSVNSLQIVSLNGNCNASH